MVILYSNLNTRDSGEEYASLPPLERNISFNNISFIYQNGCYVGFERRVMKKLHRVLFMHKIVIIKIFFRKLIQKRINALQIRNSKCAKRSLLIGIRMHICSTLHFMICSLIKSANSFQESSEKLIKIVLNRKHNIWTNYYA